MWCIYTTHTMDTQTVDVHTVCLYTHTCNSGGVLGSPGDGGGTSEHWLRPSFFCKNNQQLSTSSWSCCPYLLLPTSRWVAGSSLHIRVKHNVQADLLELGSEFPYTSKPNWKSQALPQNSRPWQGRLCPGRSEAAFLSLAPATRDMSSASHFSSFHSGPENKQRKPFKKGSRTC